MNAPHIGDNRNLYRLLGKVAVPMAFLSSLVWHLPIFVCIICVRIEEAVKFIILMRRFFSKKWVRIVIHDIGDDRRTIVDKNEQ